MLVLAISGLNTLMLSEDVLILHYYVNDAAIGQYGIITAIVGLIAIGKSAVNAIFVPDFAKSIQEKRSPDAKNLFNLSRTLSTLWAVFALGILLLVFAFAPQWVAIPRKSIFLSIIIFLALGKLSSAMIGPCTNVMFINGGAALIAWSVLTACVLNFFGNLALVPFYGLLGAAISTGLSIMALNLWQFAHVKKRYKF
ncbi:MAG: polysaccharide biosynthesis C-terminal domain-containing protein [Hyphomicrobiales bacterium]